MVSQRSKKLDLQSCASCGTYNPLSFRSCSGCGERQSVLHPVPGGSGSRRDEAGKQQALVEVPFTTVPIWPLWTTNDEQRLGCALADLPGFVTGRSLLAADRKTGLAVDESAHKLCVFEVVKDTKRGGKATIQCRIVGYEAIAEVQTVDGISRRPLTKATGVTDEIVALLLRLEQGGPRFEALVNLMTKPQSPGSDNHRAALMRAKEWQTYLIGLMHLPGLLAFSASAAGA